MIPSTREPATLKIARSKGYDPIDRIGVHIGLFPHTTIYKHMQAAFLAIIGLTRLWPRCVSAGLPIPQLTISYVSHIVDWISAVRNVDSRFVSSRILLRVGPAFD